MKRGEIRWAELGPYRPREQTGRRPVVIRQSDTLTRVLQSVLVIPLTTNTERANIAGTALIASSEEGRLEDSIALAFQLRAIPKFALKTKIRNLSETELVELEGRSRTGPSGEDPKDSLQSVARSAFTKDDVVEILNLQPLGHEAKAYQAAKGLG